MKILIPILLLVSNLAWAETSAEFAKAYFGDLESGNFEAAAEKFDPEQLNEFRTMMEFYKEIPAQAQTQFIQTFFGPDQTIETVDKATDVQFFSGVFSFIMRQAEAAGGLNFDGFEILGEVMEGDVVHLVTRNRVSVGELEMEAMEVVSVKKQGDSWKLMLSGKMKGLPEQLKAAFGAAK